MKRTIALALCTLSFEASPVDLGAVGPTYGIAEPHLLDDIQRRLREKERSGELRRLIDHAKARGIEVVRSPAPVPGITAAPKARTFLVDPSFTLGRNIFDAQGRLMFAAGTRKNPLEVVSMSRQLLFFDARDADQVRYARRLVSTHAGRIKPILTGGSYLELMKAWRVPVFYDQQGALTKRLGIRHVPALVSQEGMSLRIDEVALR